MNWESFIDNEKKQEYFKGINSFLHNENKTKIIYPEKTLILNAFKQTSLDNLKVVILGQDPYHNDGQAMGLAFSVPSKIKIPPSLKNIFKEIQSNMKRPSSCLDGNLTPWAKQGVLLLNTALSVEAHKANSHKNIGWLKFTDNVIEHISEDKENIIFLLWGSKAISKSKLIDTTKHHILTAPHPSPLSAYRGFFGCEHFSKCNGILRSLNKREIIW